jgi:hypothetical protein
MQISGGLWAQTKTTEDILRTSDSLAALYGNAGLENDGPLRIRAVSGGSLTVPEGKLWMIDQVTVGDGSGFNIAVKSLEYPDTLFPGEKIVIPVFGSETHLLDNPSDATYTFTINEMNHE